MVATKPRVRASTEVARELGASAMHRWEDYVACGAPQRARRSAMGGAEAKRAELEEVLRKALAGDVASAMTTPVVSIAPRATIQEAAALLLRHHVSRLPVVDDDE